MPQFRRRAFQRCRSNEPFEHSTFWAHTCSSLLIFFGLFLSIHDCYSRSGRGWSSRRAGSIGRHALAQPPRG
ncbi:unnamed protein product [Protopolystoma xenopodis]|uniref:Uncharacterized protein n=1 Tax=Protopolystoma xenopodis TaxID=117903 RepID=A0A448X825_9PLAT|nr:unnamed protein product [Protopolystoma xenopodis]